MSGVFLTFLVGIVALVAITAACLAAVALRKAARLEEQRALDHAELEALRETLRASRAAAADSAAAMSAPVMAMTEVAVPVPPPLPPLPPLDMAATGDASEAGSARAAPSIPVAPEVPVPPPVPVSVPPTAPGPEGTTPGFEQFVGARLFAWLGGIALFLGAAFALQWSIQQGLVPPGVRVAAGFAASLGLVAAGWRLRLRGDAPSTAAALLGAGVLVGFGTSFAAHGLYRLPWYGAGTLFAANALLAGAGAWIADRLEARAAAWLAFAGGFATPLVLHRADVSSAGIHGFSLLLLAGACLLALRRGWRGLGIAAVVFQVLHGIASADVDSATSLLLGWPAVAGAAVVLVFAARARAAAEAPGRSWNVMAAFALAGGGLRLLGFDVGPAEALVAFFALEAMGGVARVRGVIAAPAMIPLRLVALAIFLRGTEEAWEQGLVALVAVGLLRDGVAVATVRRGQSLAPLAAWSDSVMTLLVAAMAVGWADGDAAPLLGLAAALVLALGGLVAADLVHGLRRPALVLAGWALVAWMLVPDPASRSGFLALVGAGFAVFVGFGLRRLAVDSTNASGWVVAALAGPVHYFLARPVLLEVFPGVHEGTWPIVAALAYAVLLGVVARLAPRETPGRGGLLAWFGGTLAAFLALAVPEFLGDEARIAAWAVQGAAFAVLGRFRAEAWLRWTGALLLAGTTSWLLGRDLGAMAGRGDVFLVGPYLPVHVALVGSLLLSAWAARGTPCVTDEARSCAARLAAIAVAAAALVAFALAHLVLDDAFAPAGRRLDLFDLHGFWHGMAVTVLWASCGVAAIVGGLLRGAVAVRRVGLALLLLALGKLFLNDLAGLGALPRVLAFMVVAALSLLASYVVQRAPRAPRS